MKRTRFFAMLILMVSASFMACQKEQVKVLGDHYEKAGGTSNFFHITCASLTEGVVNLDIIHGGKVPGDFSYTWDGKITIQHPDSCATCGQIEIIVVKTDANPDKDTLSFRQSVTINLSDLKIKADQLKDGTVLKIINNYDATNAAIFVINNGAGKGGECTNTHSGGEGDGTNLIGMTLPVIVVESTCNKGTWGNLWLKTDFTPTDSIKPPYSFLMPVLIAYPDSLYGYTPKVGDHLFVRFIKTISDEVCEERKSDTQPASILYLYKR